LAKSGQAWIWSQDGKLRVGQIGADSGVVDLCHSVEGFERTVFVAETGVDQRANPGPLRVTRGDFFGFGAPASRRIGVTEKTWRSCAAWSCLSKIVIASFNRPFCEAVVEQNGQRFRVLKGAMRTVAQACGLQTEAIAALETRVDEPAQKGYRTLAVARGPETGAAGLLGLVTLYDPPRPDAKQLITELRDLGVSVKMLTGDAVPVAREIGRGVAWRTYAAL
jgi:hypothetical protein